MQNKISKLVIVQCRIGSNLLPNKVLKDLVAKRIFKTIYRDNPDFSFYDLLEFLDKNKEITAINQKYVGMNWYRHHLDELKNVKKSWALSNV